MIFNSPLDEVPFQSNAPKIRVDFASSDFVRSAYQLVPKFDLHLALVFQSELAEYAIKYLVLFLAIKQGESIKINYKLLHVLSPLD
jgi:hypothetical protein